AAFLVANPSLRWGKPSGGEIKSTNRKPGGVKQHDRAEQTRSQTPTSQNPLWRRPGWDQIA
ncbi:MAG: hypothetical protein ACLP9L_31320, partial [Thermoguttaceae bacterium]